MTEDEFQILPSQRIRSMASQIKHLTEQRDELLVVLEAVVATRKCCCQAGIPAIEAARAATAKAKGLKK